MKYALIGEKLSHSFSKILHERLGLSYDLKELNKEEVGTFVLNNDYDGFNVTIPYKKEVIPYLDEISPLSSLVGSVNTVVKRGGKNFGFNTDVRGLEYQIESRGVTLTDKNVLILGSGGASLTAVALCKSKNVKSYKVVSRSGEVNYENCYDFINTEIIINTTPVGMYPNQEGLPIEIDRFPSLVAVFDLIYNPIRTNLVLEAERRGIITSGGLKMLCMQGIKSEELWLDKKIEEEVAETLIKSIAVEKNNLVLSGMAGCGKSTVGKATAERLNLPFFDVDEEITKISKKTPSQIINEEGEERFREIETEVVKELSKTGGKVISLGGGSILREENQRALKRNGIVIYLSRDIEKLALDNRPLSQKYGIRELFEKRKETYFKSADVIVSNDGEISKTIEEVIKEYENSCYKRS